MMADLSGTGGVQPHGLLVVLEGEGLLILQASANVAPALGLGARDLSGVPFLELVDPAARAAVERAVRQSWRGEEEPFEVSFAPVAPGAPAPVFDAIARGLPDGVIVVELERDPAPHRGDSPSPGSDSAGSLLRRSLHAVANLSLPWEIAGVMAREIQRFTGFARVVVVRQDPGFEGEVVAEERTPEMEPLLGRHFPAAAWSAETLEEFRGGRACFILDAAAPPVPLVPSVCPGKEAPPDLMARAAVRSPAASTVSFLASQDVASSLTVPLVVEDRLWGLIVCQHRLPKYLTPALRSAVSLCASVLASQIGIARRAMEDLRRFAGVVAHEVKGQIQPGLLALSMIRTGRGGSATPELVRIAGMGERSLSGLVDFTREMLAFADAEMSAHLEEIDLQPVADQVVRQLSLEVPGDGVRFEISALPRIRGLRVQMQHVLVNLLRNAFLHGREGLQPLHVHVGYQVDPGHGPVVFVRDDGRGIAAEEQQRIFDYFARGRACRVPGSGVGLAFCDQVIQRQGNRLWVESAPGEGATFYFTVSLATDGPMSS